jgi:hypothetical protein
MCPETQEHLRIKELVLETLRKTYGLGLKEYPDSGNIADVFVITPDGIEIFVENVWASSKTNFYRDLHILRNSGAAVKIFIVNSDIINDEQLRREYDKARISETKRGIAISSFVNGSQILDNPNFVNQEFAQTVDKLVAFQRSQLTKRTNSKEALKHSKKILLTRSDYQGLDHWYHGTLMQNLLTNGSKRLETTCLIKHFETGYTDKLRKPLMEYKQIMEKYGYLAIPRLGNQQEKKIEAFKQKPTIAEELLLTEAQKQFLQSLEEVIFVVQNGIPLNGWCNFCSTFKEAKDKNNL